MRKIFNILLKMNLCLIMALFISSEAFGACNEASPNGSSGDVTYYDGIFAVHTTSNPVADAVIGIIDDSNGSDGGAAIQLAHKGGGYGGCALQGRGNGGLKIWTYEEPIGSESFQDRFTINSSGVVSGTFGTYHSASDIRLKKDVTTIPEALTKVMSLRPVYFKWKEENDPSNDGAEHIGLIAQEVEKIVPEVVHTNKTDGKNSLGASNEGAVDKMEGIKSVQYQYLIGLLVEAIKEQSSKLAELKGVLNSLEASK